MSKIKVRSSVHVGGLAPGQEAEVEDTPQVRSLIERGFWALLVPATRPVVQPVQAPSVDSADGDSGDDSPGVSVGDTTNRGNARRSNR